jgi:hypothetical protein
VGRCPGQLVAGRFRIGITRLFSLVARAGAAPAEQVNLATGTITYLAADLLGLPSKWWPSDRRWIVVTPADGHSTLVGCDQKAAQELLADSAIEAWPISRNASVSRL